MQSFEVVEPRTVEEALSFLDQGDPAIRPIGGGTALVLMMKAQLFRPVRLVSLRRLGVPFSGINLAGKDMLRIGAMTTFSDLEASALIGEHLPVVTRTLPALANIRVRNVATVGGNIAHGDPHLDLPPVWLALDAEVRILGRSGERVVPIEEIFLGYYETSLADGEVIAEIRVPVRPQRRSTYVKVTTRSLHDWPAIGLALSVRITDGLVRDARVVLSAALDKPTRLRGVEDALRGEQLSAATVAGIAALAAEQAGMGSDGRGSAPYKRQLLRVHMSRALRGLAGA
jgi:carbon-monoxide dehydrogenase medium subunit